MALHSKLDILYILPADSTGTKAVRNNQTELCEVGENIAIFKTDHEIGNQ